MLLKWQRILRAAENGDGGGGGGAPNPSDPAIQALIKAAVDQEVGGLKSKNQELLGELAKGKPLLQAIEEIGGPDALKELGEIRRKLAEDEDGKLFMSGKRTDYDQRILARASEKHAKEADALNKRIVELDEAGKQTQAKLARRIVHSAVMQAAAVAGVADTALEDVAFAAERQFRLAEDGETIEAVDDKGEPVLNTKGQPLSVADWLEEKRDPKAKPHWFKAVSGGGAQSSARMAGGVHRLSRVDAKDPQKYQAAKAAAEKAGVPLEIEPA